MTRNRLVVGLCAFALLGILVALGAMRLSQASSSLRTAERAIESASEAVKAGRIADARASLDDAKVAVLEANESLRSSSSLTFLGLLPVVSQNLDSLTTSVDVAATVIHGGQRILASSTVLEGPDGTLQVSLSEGSIPIDSVRDAQDEVRTLLEQLVEAGEWSDSALLLPATEELRDAVRTEVERRVAELERVSRGLTLLDALVGGDRPRRYLIAVSNTAEMRGTGGMMLNYGVLEGEDGTVDLTAFGRVEELELGTPIDPSSVDLPEDYLRRWDGFDVTGEWRNATMSADLSLVAPVLQAMYQRATNLPADGVIQIDPRGLARILEAVGPVDVEVVGRVTADNVEALVLNEAYRRFPGVEQRSDVLGNVAEAAFRRLVAGEFDSVRDLAVVIGDAVDGRHLAASVADTDTDAALGFFGADGSLPPADQIDHAHLTVQNLSGNKLDYYLDTDISISGSRPAGDVGTVEAEITLTNTAPAGETQPRYIFGPFDESQPAGNYRAAVTLYLPTGSSLVSSDGESYELPPDLQTEDGRPLVGYIVDVPAGGQVVTRLELRLPPRPDSEYRFLLVPSARVRPTTASVALTVDDDVVDDAVVLDRPWVLSPGRPPRAQGRS